MNKRGSSLLLVMLITAGILVVVFGSQRLALVQFSQSARDEDNQTAYYAARAGIEDGLLRFRFNRNVETSNDQLIDVANGQDSTSMLNGGQPSGTDPSHEYYQLNISFKSNKLGDSSDESTWKTIVKDEVLTLTGFGDEDSYLYYKIRFSAGSPCLAQFQQIRAGAPPYELYTALPPPGLLYESSKDGINMAIRGGSQALLNSVRIRAVGCDMKIFIKTTSGSTTSTDSGITFDNTITTITSTGYFGSTKRTLVATIDRISGTLIGIYDMTLYGATGNVSPP